MKRIRCGITGYRGVLGKRFIKLFPLNFIKYKGDLLDTKKLKAWVLGNQFDLFLHFGAIVPTKKVDVNFILAKKINIKSTENIIKFLIKKKSKPKWFFFSSTSHVYKLFSYHKLINEKSSIQPSTKYGKTKYLAEQKILKYKNKLNICIGRIFSFTDKSQKRMYVVPAIKKKLNQKKKVIYFDNINHHRDFLSTKKISKIIYNLYTNKKTGIYNIGSGCSTSLLKLVKYYALKKNKRIIISKNKPTFLIANNSKLKKLGIKFNKLSFNKILDEK